MTQRAVPPPWPGSTRCWGTQLVVVATPDVDESLVLLGRLEVEPAARVHDAGTVAAELDQAAAVALVVHAAQVGLVVL
jgi:hypothetical protein